MGGTVERQRAPEALCANAPHAALSRAGRSRKPKAKPPQGGAGEAQRSELRRGCRAKVQGTDLKTRVPSGSLDGDP